MEKAVAGLYHVKSFSEDEYALSTLILRLGGRGLVHAMRDRGGPAYSTIRKRLENLARFYFCHAGYNEDTVVSNVRSALASDVIKYQPRSSHADETAVLPKVDWCPVSNCITGFCAENHAHVDLCFSSVAVCDSVLEAAEQGDIHVAKEALIVSVAGLGRDAYAAVPVLGLASCKRGGKEFARAVISQFLDTWTDGVHAGLNGTLKRWMLGALDMASVQRL
eukprot:GHVU01228555.1.p1 GENE.GHVU01228555.1~~GHVU01228555.1.p1  ORF type:complete len:221 (-),score=17.59 GHVU01228555.1:135-797(-)